MKRKIIITESQYNKLQEFLFETTDVNHTLDFVKVGDVLKFKSLGNKPYDIKIAHVDHASNEILGKFLNGEKVRFNFNAYDEQTKKFNFQILDNKTQKYVNKQDDVTRELDIERNGQVVQIPDVGGNKQPGQGPVEPVGQPDEIAKPIELDPNVTATPKTPEEVENIKKQRMYGKKALKAITSDPKLQAAFYRQPSFWKLFMADMQGKTASGKGIQPTLALINGYLDKNNKENHPELSSFKMGRKADFELLDDITFTDNNNKVVSIPKNQLGTPYKATNMQSNFLDTTMGNYQDATMLQSSDTDNKLGVQFKIMVKPNPVKEDTFNCDIIHNSKVVARDIKIKFLNSSGYNKTKTK